MKIIRFILIKLLPFWVYLICSTAALVILEHYDIPVFTLTKINLPLGAESVFPLNYATAEGIAFGMLIPLVIGYGAYRSQHRRKKNDKRVSL